MNQHITPVTPDFSDTTFTATSEHNLTTPVLPSPVKYTPIVPKTNNDSLTPNADYVWEVNAEQRRKWEDSWQDNAETAGDEPDIVQTEANVRYAGLVSYVTSGLSPESAELSKKIFGKTSTPYTGDSYSNLIVGRALCSMAGAKGNPVKFIREHGAQLNLSMPTAGYDTDNQLYTLIGSTFATKERDDLTKRQQEAQAKAKEAEQRRADVLPDALTAMATGDFVTPLQRQVLDEVGFDALTVRRVRQLTQRTAPLATKDAPQTLQGDSILDGVHLLGLEHNTSLKGFSLFSTKDLYDASVIIGDDPIARAVYLNLMRIAGRRHRDSHHSDSFFGNLGDATSNLLLSATRGVSEPLIKSGTDIGMSLAADLNEEDNINVKRYQALRADAEAAFQQGYQERSDELAQNLGSSILWQISDFPTTMAPAVSTTASFLSATTSLAYFLGGNTDRRYEARANSMREGDTSTNFIEHGLVPTLKTGVEAASVYATGKSADLLSKGLGKTSLGKAVSARLAYSPKLSYAARVTEGVTTEITEELVEAVGNEAVELTGIVKDRQKEEHWTNFQKTFLSGEFWAGNVGMNLLFASFGYKGSRSKQPFKSLFDDLGFTKKEQKALQDDLANAQQAGANSHQLGDIVKEHILKKESANPEEFKQKAINVMANAQQQQLIQEAAANGVRDAIIKQAGISDMVKDADGNIKLKRLSRAEDGKFEMVEETYTEEQLNTWLASNVESTLTQEIIDTQRTVRGEKVSRAVESSKNTPFSRVISMLNAPAELIAKMKDKSSFDEEAMQMFAEFALEEINYRISSGQSAEEARNAEFGTTGASLGAVANLASNFAERVAQARATGELEEDEIAQSNAFILPGRTPGDNILMIARGEASAKDVAHDWLEVFGRSRFYTNPSYWRAALDALDADLLNNGIITKSLFDKPQGSRSDLNYIEAFSHLAEADWLASHDIYAVSDNTHNILDEVMDDLGAVQGGLETAKILKNYLDSDAAKATIGSAIDPLREVLTKAGATLTDILTTAQESAPKDAADFVLRQRGYIQESTAQDLQTLGQEADSPAPLNTTTENPQEDALPPEASDGTPVTVADLAQMNGIDPQTGSVPVPPNATYSRVDPKESGKNLIGGIAHGQPDGSICGAAKLSDISIHPSIGKVDPANVRTNPDEKEVILFRKKDGTLQAIGGLSFLNHSTSFGVENVPVRVYSSGKNFTPQWAARFAMESKIRANLATTADLLSYFTKNNITRDQARSQNLIPKDYAGQELSASRAAWLLLEYATKKDIASVISGKLTVKQALLNSAPKVAKQKEQEQSLNTPQPLDPYASIFKDGKHSEASTTEPDVRTGQVPIASITHSPDVQQFKRTRGGREAKKDGVVNELPGDYKTHDPIHLWLRTDGSLVVISGRHRLAKAIQSGAKYIPATVYPETETRNAQWARIHDFEQNVMDNQASVADIALYVQGLNPHGRKLTQEETEQFNRANSNAEKGLYIGLHGSPDLVYAHSINALSADYALKIAKAFPDDFDAQQQAIASLMDNNGITEALDSATIYRDLRNNQSQELNFGDSQKQEAFNRFFAQYAANKVKELGRKKAKHNVAKTDKSIREHEKVGIHVTNPEENRKELQRLSLEQDKWRNPGLYPELRQEAEEAFNNSEEAAQTYLNLDFSQQEQDLFSSSFSVIGKKAKTWDKYVDKAFKGRDDGLMRAEIDDSQARLKLFNDNDYGLIVDEIERFIKSNKKALQDYKEALKEKEEFSWVSEYMRVRDLADVKQEQINKNLSDAEKVVEDLEDKLISDLDLTSYYKSLSYPEDKVFKFRIRKILREEESPSELAALVTLLDYNDKTFKLSDVMIHHELFEAYPELKDINISFKKLNMDRLAETDGKNITFNSQIPRTREDILSTILHETQHVIQRIEGFAPGSNPISAHVYLKNYLEGFQVKHLQGKLETISAFFAYLEQLDELTPLVEEILTKAKKANAISKSETASEHEKHAYSFELSRAQISFRKKSKFNDSLITLAPDLNEKVFKITHLIGGGLVDTDENLPKLEQYVSYFREGIFKHFRKEISELTSLTEGLISDFLDLTFEKEKKLRILEKLKDLSPGEIYDRIAGEIESRNVQYRMNMTAEERAATPFNSTLEYPGEAIAMPPLSSFSITPARARRKYMPLAEAVKLEQYVALEEYARKLFRDAKRLTLANPKNRLDDATEAAIHLRSLLNAVFAILPKDAQPWKALQFAKANIDALTWAVANPHLDLTPRIAPGLTPAEIDKYNESGWRDRRQWLTNKISKLIVSVADSAARSIEAHACRVLLQTAEDAIKTLDPKQQPSGKERRGTTSARVFEKAQAYFLMFDWSPDQRAEELAKESDILNDPDASPEEHAEASRRRNAILLFAGLNKESLPRVKAGVETLLAYIQTGKEEWNKKLLEERRATEAIQEALSVVEPTISHSQTTARETRKQGTFKRFLTSFLNPVATLKIFASLPGKAGEAFTALRAKLAIAQDAKTYAINQAHRDAENALDDILGVTGKPAAMRDMARADFLTKANEYQKTGIIKKGRIKITKFELKPADVENLANIRNTQGIEAFNAALDTYRKAYSKQDKRQDSIPYDEVWNDILSQMKSPDYRGGTIYVEHYGQRDTDHVEELELTRLQAANLWLLAQQPSYSNIYDQDGKLIERGMLDILGYTDEIIDQLEIYCGKELIDYAIWKREYLNTTGLFEAYEEYMGLPFPKEENYWPGAFDTPSANGGLDAFNTTYEGSGVYSMLILRKKHLNEPNLAIDLEAAWEHAISQHFHYIHLSPLTRQIRAIMRDPDTKARMRKIAGRTPLDNLDVGLNALDGAPAMQLQAAIQANSLASRLWGSFAKALLNMATLTGIKQVSALGHALVHKNINIINIVPKLITSLLSEIKGIKIGAITPSEIRKLDSFKIRKDRENLTSKASQLKPGQTQGKLALIDVLGGRVLEYSDYWANSVAMAAVYNTEYARAKKLMLQASGNKTLTPEQETELRQHCENTVSIALKQTAQPLEREDKPAALQQQNWAQMQNAFMMGEVLSKIACATSIYKSERAKAYGKSDIEKRKAFWRAIFKTYKYIGGMSMASQGILAILAYTLGSAPEVGDDDFDEWFISQLLAGALGFGYLTPIPVIGESVGGFGQYAFGQYGAFATYENTGIGASLKDLRDLEKAFNTDKGAAERAYAGSNSLRWASALINFSLGGTKYGNAVAELFSAANNINNATRPALQYAKNTEKKSNKTKKSTLKKLQSAKKAATKSRYTKKVHKPTVDY